MKRDAAQLCACTRAAIFAAFTGLLLAAPTTQAALVYALTDENDLISFDSDAPENLLSAGAISGLEFGSGFNDRDLVGIDIRPANNKLYGVGNFGGIFEINPNTFNAKYVSSLTTPLLGSRFGVDFNPVVDRLRIVSDVGQNLRVNVDTGATTVDSLLQYGPGQLGATGDNPIVVGAAYTNSSFGTAASTTLYDIDVRTNEDRLVIQNPPNNGTLTVVGPLGVNASSLLGFDILFQGGNNTGLAAMQLTTGGVTQLYSINLTSGSATLIGDIGGGDLIDGLAVVAIPEPAAFGMAALSLIGGVLLRRRDC
jgi:hypothetical protein